MNKLLAVFATATLLGCQTPVTKCEVVVIIDAGTPPPEVDAGAPDFEAQLVIVNLSRDTVTVTLDGEDAGQPVPPLGSVYKTGHVTLIKQRGSVEARNIYADGGTQPVTLPFEFDATGEPATFVIKDTTPARISMNVTVGRQTQGATFGEKVNAGLAGVEIEGGVTTTSSCTADHAAPSGMAARISLRDAPADEDCPGTADNDFVRPPGVDVDATPYFITGAEGGLEVAWVGKVNAGLHAAGGALAQGASLLGGALPGGSVISAAVSRATPNLYVLNASSSRATGSLTVDGVALAQNVAPGALIRVKTRDVAAAAQRSGGLSTGAIVGIAVGSTVRTGSLGATPTGPCRPPYLCDFLMGEDTLVVLSENTDSSATVLKTHHDTVKNSVGNIRRAIVLATTSASDTKGCVAVFAADDTCVMGAATAVSSVSSLAGGAGGGAAQASYAATGRLLYPPKAPPPQGEVMRFAVDEVVDPVTSRRFFWSNPLGLTPVQGKPAGGFAIVTPGTALDAAAVDQRALFFVDTSVSPWVVQTTLSR